MIIIGTFGLFVHFSNKSVLNFYAALAVNMTGNNKDSNKLSA